MPNFSILWDKAKLLGKRTVTRLLLICFGPLFIWDADSRNWWWKRFKNGGL